MVGEWLHAGTYQSPDICKVKILSYLTAPFIVGCAGRFLYLPQYYYIKWRIQEGGGHRGAIAPPPPPPKPGKQTFGSLILGDLCENGVLNILLI